MNRSVRISEEFDRSEVVITVFSNAGVCMQVEDTEDSDRCSKWTVSSVDDLLRLRDVIDAALLESERVKSLSSP